MSTGHRLQTNMLGRGRVQMALIENLCGPIVHQNLKSLIHCICHRNLFQIYANNSRHLRPVPVTRNHQQRYVSRLRFNFVPLLLRSRLFFALTVVRLAYAHDESSSMNIPWWLQCFCFMLCAVLVLGARQF